MSTRSEIGILNTDGTITSIYCHWDGDLEHNGASLSKYYADEKIVRELIKNGNLSSLRKNTIPSNENLEHNFDNPQKDVCVYYHRDRGDAWERVKPRTYPNIEEWEKEIKKGCQEYMYLFKGGKWHYTYVSKKINWRKLKNYNQSKI